MNRQNSHAQLAQCGCAKRPDTCCAPARALFYAQLAAGFEFDLGPHQILAEAVSGMNGQKVPLSLHGGISGVAMTARILSQSGKHYNKLLATLDEQLAKGVCRWQGVYRQDALTSRSFDLLSGMSGWLLYALDSENPVLAGAKRTLVSYLSDLLVLEENFPARLVIGRSLQSGVLSRLPQYQDGLIDCGMAHGMAGIISVLARAKKMRLSNERDDAILAEATLWLANLYLKEGTASVLPIVGGKPIAISAGAASASWCYGRAGILSAILSAAAAFGYDALTKQAQDSMLDLLAKEEQASSLSDTNLCHGQAGLLAICDRFFEESDCLQFERHCRRLRRLLEGQLRQPFHAGDCGLPFLENPLASRLPLLSVTTRETGWRKFLALI